MKNIEVEIQVNLENIQPLKKLLKSEAEFVSEKREIDHYYMPAHRNFISNLPISEWLRLRDSEGKFSINYKHWQRDGEGKTNHCHEYETGVDNIEQMQNILEVMDFKPVVRVEKKRRKYHYQDYEITIDRVVGLDETVEIEFKGESDKSPADITAEMIQFLRKLGVGKMKRSYQGYAFLCLYPDLAEYEEIA